MDQDDKLNVSIHSEWKLTLLNDIDKLRSLGVSELVDLPQLVVCGDQSSGKSSVLEAISGISFPTKDNLCTRFATEVVLRQSEQPGIDISIFPSQDRPENERGSLSRFGYGLESFSDFPRLVEEAHRAMSEAGTPQTFYRDILRLKISGRKQPHLTIVDLPGLIHSENKQQSAEDVKIVRRMVSKYMENRRSIILAVVSAKNDVANQVVLQLVKKYDPKGTRTLGIITKPDDLPVGSESQHEYMSLARNENIHLSLGWHVLRNRGYNERECTSAERDNEERRFFATGEWSNLSRDIIGVETLRPKLSNILFLQIKSQLPEVVADLERVIENCERSLDHLGPSRQTLPEQRAFLLKLSQIFQKIVSNATGGLYEDGYFGQADAEGAPAKRLRARIQNLNSEYAETMLLNGHEQNIVDSPSGSQDTSKSFRPYVSRSDFVGEIKELLKTDRGRELPGTYNPLLVAQVFLRHSNMWEGLATNHLNEVGNATTSFLDSVVDHVFPDSVAEALRTLIISPGMKKRRSSMLIKMKELLWPYQHCHPITYNHYFTDIVQKVKNERLKTDISTLLHKKLGMISGKRYDIDIKDIINALSSRTEADMDLYACSEILDCMTAFYKVAMKAIIDNIAIYAVEMCLIRNLEHLLDPTVVGEMDDDTIRGLATESSKDQDIRMQLQQQVDLLRRGLDTCRVHATTKGHAKGTESISMTEEHYESSSEAITPDHEERGNQKKDDKIIAEPEPLNEAVAIDPTPSLDWYGHAAKSRKKKKSSEWKWAGGVDEA